MRQVSPHCSSRGGIMLVIAAFVGAVMTGLMCYFIYGNGMELLDHFLGSGATRS